MDYFIKSISKHYNCYEPFWTANMCPVGWLSVPHHDDVVKCDEMRAVGGGGSEWVSSKNVEYIYLPKLAGPPTRNISRGAAGRRWKGEWLWQHNEVMEGSGWWQENPILTLNVIWTNELGQSTVWGNFWHLEINDIYKRRKVVFLCLYCWCLVESQFVDCVADVYVWPDARLMARERVHEDLEIYENNASDTSG